MKEGRFVITFRRYFARLVQHSNSEGGGHRSLRELRRKLPNYYANCVPSMGRVRQGWSDVGRSEDNGRECGVGRTRGAGVSCGRECGLGRSEEAGEHEEEGGDEGMEVSQ